MPKLPKFVIAKIEKAAWRIHNPNLLNRSAAEPQPKAKPFNAEERSKQRKDEESQKINHGGTEARSNTEKKASRFPISVISGEVLLSRGFHEL